MARPPIHCVWLRELAAGYLRAYASIHPQRRGGLWGYFFEPEGSRGERGFFAGFLTGRSRDARDSSFLRLQPPECAVFAFVSPATSPLHEHLVRRQGSLFRRSYELLTKYTARRPRFEFHERAGPALVRHAPLAEFPPRQREKYARSFFMEALALLVRSGLPDALLRVRPLASGLGKKSL